MSPLLTVAEVAERLSVSRTTVYQLLERGLITAHRIGAGRGSIRVSEDDLADYLEACRELNQRTEPAPKPPTRRLRHLRF